VKIILIEQAATDMAWEASYDAAGYARALERERACGIAAVERKRSPAADYAVYTGTTPAARQTAELLFELPEGPKETPLLDDVPLRPFADTRKLLPLWLWQSMGRAQWASGSGRQVEGRGETLHRAGELVDRIEAAGCDCVLISRGLTMRALKTVLRRRGYLLEGGDLRPTPLERVRATKRDLHCGGCAHNCLLSEAKCQTGKNKALGIR